MSLICTGKIENRVVANEDGEIVVKPMMTSVATGDHRFGDAAIYIPFFKTFAAYIQDPENFDHTKIAETVHYSEREEKKKE